MPTTDSGRKTTLTAAERKPPRRLILTENRCFTVNRDENLHTNKYEFKRNGLKKKPVFYGMKKILPILNRTIDFIYVHSDENSSTQ